MCWLRVKIKAKSTGVRSILSWILDHRTGQFLMCWLRVYVWLRVKTRLRVLVFVVFCRGTWIIERGNLFCAGYASTRGYASKLKVRAAVFGVREFDATDCEFS